MRRYNLGSQNAGDKESKAEENFQVSTDQGEPFAETYIIKQDRDIFVPIRSGFGTTYTGSGLTLSVSSRRCPFRKQSSFIEYKFFHDPTGNATVKASTTKTSCSKGDASDTNSVEAQDDDAGCASRYNNTNLRRLFRESGRANGPELAFGCERTNLAGLIPANP